MRQTEKQQPLVKTGTRIFVLQVLLKLVCVGPLKYEPIAGKSNYYITWILHCTMFSEQPFNSRKLILLNSPNKHTNLNMMCLLGPNYLQQYPITTSCFY